MTHRLVLFVLAAIVMGFAYWQFEQRQQREASAAVPTSNPSTTAAPDASAPSR